MFDPWACVLKENGMSPIGVDGQGCRGVVYQLCRHLTPCLRTLSLPVFLTFTPNCSLSYFFSDPASDISKSKKKTTARSQVVSA